MQREDTYRGALMRAADLVGGPAALARRLQVPISDLRSWLEGKDQPSLGTFLKIVDVLIEESGRAGFTPQNSEESG